MEDLKMRRSGLIAISLGDGDELTWVKPSSEKMIFRWSHAMDSPLF
jgi:hypothetical protein